MKVKPITFSTVYRAADVSSVAYSEPCDYLRHDPKITILCLINVSMLNKVGGVFPGRAFTVAARKTYTVRKCPLWLGRCSPPRGKQGSREEVKSFSMACGRTGCDLLLVLASEDHPCPLCKSL